MKTINIGELKNQLSAYLQYVRAGEEIIVRDRNLPVARIVPYTAMSASEEEAYLVAAGRLKLPEQEMDWDAFWAMPRPNVAHDIAVQAAIESKGDR
jgi:prevent-host-death family protein